MPILVQKNLSDKISDFEKYTIFLTQKFGIGIVFSKTLEAKTNGKIIHIPNIENMNDDEVNYLKAIVLHECAHILFSSFAEDLFKTIVSKNHLHMENFIEDARIENLMMEKFVGAEQIFYDLYFDYGLDKKFNKKVWGQADLNGLSVWYIVGFLVHNHILKIKNKKEIVSLLEEDKYKKATEFFEKHKVTIDNYVLTESLHSVQLAKILYDDYFKDEIKDKSPKNTLTKERDSIEENKKNVSSMKDKGSEMEKVLDEILKKIDEAQKLQDNYAKEKRKYIKENKERIEQVNEEVKKINKALKIGEKMAILERFKNSQNSILDKKANALDKVKNQLIELETSLAEEDNEKKATKLKEKIEKSKVKKEELESKTNEIKQKIEEYNTRISILREEFSDSIGDLYGSSLFDEKDKKLKEINEYNQKVGAFEQEISSKQSEIDELSQNFFEERKNRGSELAQDIKTIQDSLDELKIPLNVLPQFAKDLEWPESDTTQKNFDDKASSELNDIVNNGVSFTNSGSRDIMYHVNLVDDKIEHIDLGKLFADKNKLSKLESMNEIITETINVEPLMDELGIFHFNRKHYPLTTEFDKIKEESASDGKELAIIQNKNGLVISQICNIFRTKLKVQKKNRFKSNQEDGKLNTMSLYRIVVPHTDNKFFEVNDPKLVNKVTASICVDISGSMDKESNGYGEKLKELTYFLSQGLTASLINHEILGVSAPVCEPMRLMPFNPLFNRNNNNLETIVFKKFIDFKKSGIQNISLKPSDNSDGESLKIAATRLIKERSRRKIVFMISDCSPYLSGSNIGILDDNLKENIEFCHKNHVEILSFSFSNDARGQAFYGKENHCTINTWKDLTEFLWKKLS